jgi:hypothetical protein
LATQEGPVRLATEELGDACALPPIRLEWLPVPGRPSRVYRPIGVMESDRRAFDRRLLLAETLGRGNGFAV